MAASPQWWSEDTVAVVTGSNKGIGYEIVRALAEKGLTVVLTARDQGRGQAAVDTLKAAGLKNIWFHTLDIQSPESVKALATWVKEKFGGLDILVNNAGVILGSTSGPAGAEISSDNAEWIVGTNYGGTKIVTEGLLPLLRASPAGARIVNTTSRAGLYERVQDEALLKTFRDEDHYTKEVADTLAAEYLDSVKAGKSEKEWIPDKPGSLPVYSASKLFLNVYVVALAKSLAKSQSEDHQVLLSSFCPGTTQTEMFDDGVAAGFAVPEGFGMKTAAEGADTGVWLALLPREELAEKVGKFFGERTEYQFGLKNPPF